MEADATRHAQPARSAEPRELVNGGEARAPRGGPDDEWFSGFGIMGLPFASGHVLALRHFPVSSVGPGYSAVWHRTPDVQWTIYSNVPAAQSCPRYFGAALARALEAPIELEWTGPRALRVRVDGGRVLDWRVALVPTAATRVMNALARALPEPGWRNPAVLSLMGGVAGAMLDVGRVRLRGTAPNGQRFVANPQQVWLVGESTAVLEGRDLGPPGPVQPQAHLGEFWIPQRGVFAIGRSFFDRFDAARHAAAVSQ